MLALGACEEVLGEEGGRSGAELFIPFRWHRYCVIEEKLRVSKMVERFGCLLKSSRCG